MKRVDDVDEKLMTELSGCKCCFWGEGRRDRMKEDEEWMRSG